MRLSGWDFVAGVVDGHRLGMPIPGKAARADESPFRHSQDFAVAAVLAIVFYYFAHYGLHLPSEIEPSAPKDAPRLYGLPGAA
jgi:hypothetical protein